MAFLIENGTGSPLSIDDLGITLEVGETTELATRTQPQEVALSMETGNELHTLVLSGDVVVKDPLDGVSDLSPADAVVCLRTINDPHFRVGPGARVGDISDVDLTSLADNYILEYDSGSGNWVSTLNSGGTGVANAIATMNADSGTFTATGEDSFDIVGGLGITTAIVGDTLTITSDASHVFTDMREPTGFVNRTDSEITFDVGTRTFTLDVLAPATDYEYYIHGVRYTISTTKTIIIPDTTSIYHFYMDDTETLQVTTTFDEDVLLADNSYVANLYWNASPSAGTDDLVTFAEERHGITMDAETHIHFHQSLGCQYIEGLGITNIVTEPGSPSDTDVQFTVANGEIRDEDLRHEIIDNTAIPDNVFDLIQNLQPTAQIPVWFRTGASGDWNKAPATNFPFIYSDGVVFTGGVNGLMPWNEYTGATWQLTESSNNSFVLMHYFATNDILNPVVAIQGITNYNNKPAGREQALVEINQLTGLPFLEFTPIATVIVQNAGSYSNTPQARFRLTDDGFDYIDWRDTDLYGGSGGALTQNLWETITADSGSTVANTPNDTLTVAGGSGISTAIVGDTLTITNDDPNVDQNLWETIVADSGSTTADSTTDTLSILTTAGLSTSIVGDTLTISPGNDLGAIEALNTNAFLVRIGVDTWAARSLVQPAAGITIADADGVAGDPTFALANDLAAVEGLATTGLAVRTAADTWTTRGMVQPAAGITISDPAGIAGDPTFALANDLAALEALAGTGIGVRTAADTWASRTITGTTDQVDVADGDGVATDPVLTLADNTHIPGLEGINLPSGTTAERPVSPEIGDMRFNTTTGSYEAWDGVQWVIFGSVIGSGVKEIKFGQLDHLQGTTQIPYDNTPPLITEGTEFFTEDITLGVDSGRVLLWLSSIVSISNAARKATISLWRDTTLIGVTAVSVASSNDPATTTFIEVDAPGLAGTYTYSGRIGVSASATWRIGGWTANANFGGPDETNNQYVVMRVE